MAIGPEFAIICLMPPDRNPARRGLSIFARSGAGPAVMPDTQCDDRSPPHDGVRVPATWPCYGVGGVREAGMNRRVVALVVCLVAAAVAPAAAFDLNLAVGADFGGDFDLGNISLSSSTGYTLGLEIAFKVPVIELGAGFEYGFSRGASGANLDASYTQVYAIARLFFGPAYVAGRFGYADMSVSTNLGGSFGGGNTWGLGGGVEFFDKLKAELLFNNINGDLKYQSWSVRLLYTF